ncbi:VRR-NUC domain-containing protein [Streptococcus equi]|uniref:VRR-NUC domain-containing protein n=1 Tax=Streptococcus equi TaxID=1336 RepID=UPI00065862EB|nr:VRR-NUC domain-containing protein [Streptococcus equi]CRR07359.1 phage protein [Streptococcus equi subsp. equi]
MRTEKDIENYLKKKTKGLCLKFASPGTIGVPDRIVVMNTVTFFVEVKAPGKKPRPSQVAMHKKIKEAGQHVWVVDSYESVDIALKEMENWV